MDCPNQFKQYKTCEEWVKSKPKELNEAYWKIKGECYLEARFTFQILGSIKLNEFFFASIASLVDSVAATFLTYF